MPLNANPLNSHEPGEFRQRFQALFAVVFIALSILFVRMWYLQVIKGEELRQRSENNSVRMRKLPALRGLILDTSGTVLVDNQTSFDIVFIPDRSRDIRETVDKFAALCRKRSLAFAPDVPPKSRQRTFQPVRLERNVAWEKLALAETHALELPGLITEVSPVRQYLAGEVMAHVIGYIGEIGPDELERNPAAYASGDMVGKFGIEKYLDPYLRGTNGFEQVEVNAVGKGVRSLGRIDPVSGYNVVLNIDSYLQKTAWDAMAGRTGAVVVMDPRDGAILAMLSTPSFDPNLFTGKVSLADWRKLADNRLRPMENRAASGQYPPGSTYKPVVASAALGEKLITPETIVYCNGSFVMGNRTFRCWQKKGHGRVNLHRALVESCDVFFYEVGRRVGVDTLARYARELGLGAATGLDLPREKAGLIPTREWKLKRFKQPWQAGETISIAIGQGYDLVTPVQLVNAYAALANGGTVWQPRLVKRIETQDGKPVKQFPPVRRSVASISAETLKQINRGLWGVVNEPRGTGYVLRRREADVSGKTGTSQVVGLPQDEKARRLKLAVARGDHALFVCFAPDKAPEIAIAVIAEHGGHGGAAAAPVARRIIDAYFARKNAPPAPPRPVVAAAVPAGSAAATRSGTSQAGAAAEIRHGASPPERMAEHNRAITVTAPPAAATRPVVSPADRPPSPRGTGAVAADSTAPPRSAANAPPEPNP
ncbi:MAG TPA: penicillin-binding protein 2 [Syntrophales bacterium]|nr:penicillin-binding protein 2 [Syntrophales bacterium]